MNEKEIRAVFDQDTITVYQAYHPHIAIPATKAQKFVPPFKMERMTWIKPSFLWMMYRCGWAEKTGQEHVLAIKIKREGWEWALRHSCLSHYISGHHKNQESWKSQLQESPVRIQWDPEKDIHLEKLDYRSIQIGLTGIAVEKYVNEWIVSIEDITTQCKQIHSLIQNEQYDQAIALLPKEELYSVDDEIKKQIHATS